MDRYINRQMVDRAPSQQSKVRFIPVMCKYIKKQYNMEIEIEHVYYKHIKKIFIVLTL